MVLMLEIAGGALLALIAIYAFLAFIDWLDGVTSRITSEEARHRARLRMIGKWPPKRPGE